MTAEAGSRLEIRRHLGRYLVPSGVDQAAARRHLDRVVETRGPALAARALDRLLDPADPSVLCLRRLELRLSGDLAVGEEAMARLWAAGLSKALASMTRRTASGDDLMRFEDRAHYLASYAFDMAAGRADRWFYRSFEGLDELPKGAAIREAWLREPERILPVLARLASERRLDGVLATLSERDARRLLGAALEARSGVEGEEVAGLEAILVVWPTAGGAGAAKALSVVARLAARAPAVAADPRLRTWLGAVAGLAEASARLESPAELARLLATGSLARAASRLRDAGATAVLGHLPLWRRLATARPAWLEDAVLRMVPATSGRVVSATSEKMPGRVPGTSETESFVSPSAGVFLLLRGFEALGLGELLLRVVDGDRRLAGGLCWLLFRQCMGSGARTATDRALASAVGLEPREVAGAVEDLRGRRDPIGEALSSGWPEWLADSGRLGAVEGPWIVEVFTDDSGKSWRAVRDPGTDFWLALWPRDVTEPAFLKGREILLVDRDRAMPEDLSEPLLSFLRNARPAADELAFLAPREDDALGALGFALVAVAQTLLRDLAHRLPGFGWSRVSHIAESFLAGLGEVEISSEALHITLPPCPLRLVLRMSGMATATFDSSWLGSQVQLSLPKE